MFKKIAVAATLAMLASSSFAAGPFYAGVEVGSTKIDGLDRETSYGALIGYTFTENFALEGGYRRADFDGATVDQTAVSVVGTLPLSNGFNVFGRLGYNRLEVKFDDGKESESKALYGVGVGYAFTPTVSGRIEVQKPHSDATNISAGVVFRF